MSKRNKLHSILALAICDKLGTKHVLSIPNVDRYVMPNLNSYRIPRSHVRPSDKETALNLIDAVKRYLLQMGNDAEVVMCIMHSGSIAAMKKRKALFSSIPGQMYTTQDSEFALAY